MPQEKKCRGWPLSTQDKMTILFCVYYELICMLHSASSQRMEHCSSVSEKSYKLHALVYTVDRVSNLPLKPTSLTLFSPCNRPKTQLPSLMS